MQSSSGRDPSTHEAKLSDPSTHEAKLSDPSPHEAKLGWKPKGPLKGHPTTDSTLDFGDLQLAIDSGQWKSDHNMLYWIWETHLSLQQSGKAIPAGFGSQEFWSEVDRVIWDEPCHQEGPDEEGEDTMDSAFDRAWQDTATNQQGKKKIE